MQTVPAVFRATQFCTLTRVYMQRARVVVESERLFFFFAYTSLADATFVARNEHREPAHNAGGQGHLMHERQTALFKLQSRKFNQSAKEYTP